MTRRQDPTQWFDQFTPEWLQDEGIGGNEQWCARHWAPCPGLGGNGLLATVKLTVIVLEKRLPSTSPYCCQLGDQAMYDLWGTCPPSGGD